MPTIPLHAAAGAASAAFGLARTAIEAMTTNASQANPATSAANNQGQRRIAGQAREFESVFLAQVLNTMNAGVGQNTGFDGGHAEAQWRSLLNEHLARDVAARGGVGVADSVSRELIRAQEARR